MIAVDAIIESTTHVPVIGIYTLPLVANLFPGIPEELFLLAVGYLTREGVINFWFAYFVFTIGFLFIDTILFTITREGSFLLGRMKKRLARMGLIDNAEVIARNARMIIFVSRFILFMRWIGPVLTGVARISYRRFLLNDLLALLVYVPLVLLVGRYFHSRIDRIIEGINVAGNYATTAIAILILITIAILGRKTFLRSIKKLINRNGNGNGVLKKLGLTKIKE